MELSRVLDHLLDITMGAKEYNRINKIYKLTLGLSLIYYDCWKQLLLFLYSLKEIMGLFTKNKETLDAGVIALRTY